MGYCDHIHNAIAQLWALGVPVTPRKAYRALEQAAITGWVWAHRLSYCFVQVMAPHRTVDAVRLGTNLFPKQLVGNGHLYFSTAFKLELALSADNELVHWLAPAEFSAHHTSRGNGEAIRSKSELRARLWRQATERADELNAAEMAC